MHCEFTYQQVPGTLDSYPTPLSADCTIESSAASSSQSFAGGFSYGEALNGFFLLLILAILFFKVVMDRSLGVKTQRTENYER